jgi:catechol 2,3-dioxygenase-like lactoylglutathione lyase family enzyme
VTGHVAGIDHVALPMRDAAATAAFYRSLGFEVEEQRAVVCVRVGVQMVNFHRPEVWSRAAFTLRAPAAVPPCGDLCFVWDGGADALAGRLRDLGIVVEEGPVERVGGRGTAGSSVYVRDPDGNLIEFIVYGK